MSWSDDKELSSGVDVIGWNSLSKKKKKTLSQQILSNKLLLVVTDGKKSSFSSEFKLELITTYQLKLLEKCYENFVNIALCNKEIT